MSFAPSHTPMPLPAAIAEIAALLPAIQALTPNLQSLGQAMLSCWQQGGKILTCGNGGSAADAIHLAEELTCRFQKPRKALAAIALLDGATLTCAGNDFGFDNVFSRQVDALGKPGDILIGFTTSGNSANIISAVDMARQKGMTTAVFLGRDGGKLKGQCDFELLVPAPTAHRVQEAHLILYHTLCQWIDTEVG